MEPKVVVEKEYQCPTDGIEVTSVTVCRYKSPFFFKNDISEKTNPSFNKDLGGWNLKGSPGKPV